MVCDNSIDRIKELLDQGGRRGARRPEGITSRGDFAVGFNFEFAADLHTVVFASECLACRRTNGPSSRGH
jgi:hypothetical protein